MLVPLMVFSVCHATEHGVQYGTMKWIVFQTCSFLSEFYVKVEGDLDSVEKRKFKAILPLSIAISTKISRHFILRIWAQQGEQCSVIGGRTY
jgi:hypothetical protein